MNQVGLCFLTYANLEVRETLEAITHFIECFKEFVDIHGIHLNPEWTELVLDLREGSGNLTDYCGYYLGTRNTVYWFDWFKVVNLEIWKAVPGVTPTDAHIGTPHNSQDGKLKLNSKLLIIHNHQSRNLSARSGEDSDAANHGESSQVYIISLLLANKFICQWGPCPNLLIRLSGITTRCFLTRGLFLRAVLTTCET